MLLGCAGEEPQDFQAQSTRTPREMGVNQRTFPSVDLHSQPCFAYEQFLAYNSQIQEHLRRAE